jgi:hypothetical protein
MLMHNAESALETPRVPALLTALISAIPARLSPRPGEALTVAELEELARTMRYG